MLEISKFRRSSFETINYLNEPNPTIKLWVVDARYAVYSH
jgi:hypothetical protein